MSKIKASLEPSTAVYVCNPALRRLKQNDEESEASPSYRDGAIEER